MTFREFYIILKRNNEKLEFEINSKAKNSLDFLIRFRGYDKYLRSRVHGSIHNGIFLGSILYENNNYFIDDTRSDKNYHSILYSDRHVDDFKFYKSLLNKSNCSYSSRRMKRSEKKPINNTNICFIKIISDHHTFNYVQGKKGMKFVRLFYTSSLLSIDFSFLIIEK